jgi:hypothetical protein
MPPLSTNITDDDNKTSSIFFDLDSDQFIIFTSNDAPNNSTVSLLNLFTLPSPVPYKKQKLTATFT